ncbi:MOSC domain-containing protein [Microbacterium sp. SMR1]|uniref:MOSC domain-containing protein n=1 Tax=Microbacterium sp. SMR1 TaxID=1497340 RepID=UPI000DCD3689|nr:MOSC domain-containing protein [Microbacterium sp. SMR1]RAZ32950.1 MOSC domain-containing protein [Microbacterium sp. SMR1]
MPVVSALYRYPVKGFTPEARDELIVQPDGRIAGDRVLAFRFADAVEPEGADGLESWPKSRGLALMDFPALARVALQFDADARWLRLSADGVVLAEAGLDDAGRRELEEAVTAFVQASPDARRLEKEGVLPLRLVGDGVTARFQDRARGYVSLHGAASVEDVDAAVAAPVDSRRFRSNIVVSGAGAWDELGWSGRVRIGEVAFDVQRPIGRCAAIMANPDTGERDARLLRVLTTEFDQAEPTLGILLLPAAGGGAVRVGDEVVVEG